MTSAVDVLTDTFDRVNGMVHRVLDGLEPEQLSARLDPEANSIAWLIWHLSRGQDAQVAAALNTEQLWQSAGWAERFALPFDTSETGHGQAADQVGHVGEAPAVTTQLLGDYFDAVNESTLAGIATLSESDLDRIVDTRWNPPVTLAARLISIVNDDIQHAGQAAFVKGVLSRR
ncbi:mycothiol transferase [Subtercola lobariae]|uniref:DUF664 domain-containing protein n=1 Tax=Subtercola lobariae TaxID=1588641 RepID=A0A917BED9_9MICO|nr:DUF664 domain-containing protein [Subtercola lobariae]GGF34611.1 hypothetical protein GCM10011399_29660 [Subtercola lobariae]